MYKSALRERSYADRIILLIDTVKRSFCLRTTLNTKNYKDEYRDELHDELYAHIDRENQVKSPKHLSIHFGKSAGSR